MTDITNRKRLEECDKEEVCLVQNGDAFVVRYAEDKRLIIVSDAMARRWSYEDAKQIRHWIDPANPNLCTPAKRVRKPFEIRWHYTSIRKGSIIVCDLPKDGWRTLTVHSIRDLVISKSKSDCAAENDPVLS